MQRELLEQWIEALPSPRAGRDDVSVTGYRMSPGLLYLAVSGETALLTVAEWRALVDGVERRLKEQEGG